MAARWLVIMMATFYWLSVLLVVGPEQGTEYLAAGLMALPVLILSRAQALQRLLSIAIIAGVFVLGVSHTDRYTDHVPCYDNATADGVALDEVIAAEIRRFSMLAASVVAYNLTPDHIAALGFVTSVQDFPVQLNIIWQVRCVGKKKPKIFLRSEDTVPF